MRAWEEAGGEEGPWSGVAEGGGAKQRPRAPLLAPQLGAYLPWRIHSVYSFRESLLWPEALVQQAKALGLGALALADREGVWGAVPFVEACWRHGLKPILGALVPVEAGGHLALYARDEQGWRHLCGLLSLALQAGPLSWACLGARAEGLLALGGGEDGPMGLALARGDEAGALSLALAFAEAFPGWAHLEVPRPEGAWRRLATRSGLPAVAAWPWRHHGPEDERRWRLLRQGHHHLSPAEAGYHPLSIAAAQAQWVWWPEALALSQALGEHCHFEPRLGQPRLPRLPEVEDAVATLRAHCEAKLGVRYGAQPAPAVLSRLAHELDTIEAMGFADYFLIQEDIVAWCHLQGLAVGPGKGSGAGSLVGYLLGLSDVCPLQMTLCFERFLNPERPELPDVDLDVCWRRRDEALHHLTERHGAGRVARLGVVQHLGARGALRVAAQALGLDPELADRVAKSCGHSALLKERERNPSFRAWPWGRAPFCAWWELAIALEGLPDHVGLHPCGMALSPEPLEELLPVMLAPDGQRMVQADKDSSEDWGLLKVDILSNRGLTILADAVALVNQDFGLQLRPEALPTEDPWALAFLGQGRTYGVHQMESRPVQALLRQFRPEHLEDMTAITSLHRPGPISSGAKDAYIAARHGLRPVRIPHPCLEPILAHTFGTLIFQEQAIQVAVAFAGMSLAQGDRLRRALLRRDEDELRPLAKAFVAGAARQGHPSELIQEVYQLAMVGPSGYGFVKAHAAASQVIAIRQAYLKARWPVHYLVAVLNTGMGYYPPRVYLEDARHFGARLLGPCVQRSEVGFAVAGPDMAFERQGWHAAGLSCGWLVRVGLGGVPELSHRGAEAIVKARRQGGPFASVADCMRRVALPSDAWTALAQVGALDAFGLSRAQLHTALGREHGRSLAERRQTSLFAVGAEAPVASWSLAQPEPERLQAQAEAMLGFPLEPPAWARLPGGSGLAEAIQAAPGAQVRVRAELIHCRRAHTKDGKKPMAFLLLSDGVHHLDAVAFPTAYAAHRSAWGRGDPLWWVGRMGLRPDDAGVLALEEVLELDGRALSHRAGHGPALPLPRGGFA